jgi:hypothetical protein
MVRVQELSASSAWQRLPSEAQQRLMLIIVEAVTGAFKCAAVELIDTITKTQASLSKIGRVRNPSGIPSEGPSDIEKMQEQLRLDVVEYGGAIEKLLKHPAAEVDAYDELLRVAQQPIDATVAGSGTAAPAPALSAAVGGGRMISPGVPAAGKNGHS